MMGREMIQPVREQAIKISNIWRFLFNSESLIG